MKKIFYILFATVLGLGFTACSEDKPSDDSIFGGKTVQRDAFDLWLLKNYTYPYNIDFKYKMEDIESDMKYTLVPADSAKSAKLAIIVKYLWLDAYAEVAGHDFVKASVPRMIHLIGSPAYNSEGTMVLGTAEGGLKVTLYMVNWLTDDMLKDYETLNEYYFHTMHHEFTHILNQKKPYDTNFDLITESDYVSGDWYQLTDMDALQHGFVTPYSMVEPIEDFAEMLSVYVTDSKEAWQARMEIARQWTPAKWGYYDDDSRFLNARKPASTGEDLINDKLAIVRTYMQDAWDIDIDELRDAVAHRANELSSLDLEHLN